MAQLRSRVLPKTVRHRSTLSKGELPTARKVHRSFASLRMTGWLNFASVFSRKAPDIGVPSQGELPTARKVHRSFASLRMTGWSNFAHVFSRKARDIGVPSRRGTAHRAEST
jgi:flagellar motor switch protein FliM